MLRWDDQADSAPPTPAWPIRSDTEPSVSGWHLREAPAAQDTLLDGDTEAASDIVDQRQA